MRTFTLLVSVGVTIVAMMHITPLVLAQSVKEAKARVEEKPDAPRLHYDLG